MIRSRLLQRAAVVAAALAAAGCGSLLDTSGSDPEIRLAPTHHAVVYGTVRTAAGVPVVGATVTPTIAQICPCFAANMYLAEGTRQTTDASGQYRIAYEAALPVNRAQFGGRTSIRLEVQSGTSAPVTYADAPYPLVLSLPVDSARVDVVVR